jgi:hypothetical protein
MHSCRLPVRVPDSLPLKPECYKKALRAIVFASIFGGVPEGVSGLYLYGPFLWAFLICISSPQNNLLYHFLTVHPFGLTDWQRACFHFWRDRRLSPAQTTGLRIA